ncbi:hypothetical protein D4764_14G0013150 [Takifugu flavidus]|uniref:Uncharacterized protein n=1 Tax=Takifugu flavidus TaxID=433684 RepID=A0A5C6P6K7_9TELE|nr:hypothetical protein D4764_14G0013150 [Takifugu flavidus]
MPGSVMRTRPQFCTIELTHEAGQHADIYTACPAESDNGRIGTGSLSCRGILISRWKSSRNRRKVFSSAAEPAIISHSWTDRDSSDGHNSNLPSYGGIVSADHTDGASGAVGALPGYSGAGRASSLTGRPDGVSGMVVMSYGCTTGAGLIPIHS